MVHIVGNLADFFSLVLGAIEVSAAKLAATIITALLVTLGGGLFVLVVMNRFRSKRGP